MNISLIPVRAEYLFQNNWYVQGGDKISKLQPHHPNLKDTIVFIFELKSIYRDFSRNKGQEPKLIHFGLIVF